MPPITSDETYILSFSGGKDSTALLIYLLKEKGLRPYVVFCDTSNETTDTYQYIDYVSDLIESWGFPPIIKLKGTYTFFSLAKYKKYRVEVNPMYKAGFRRVGCFPCVNIGRYELILLDKFYPDRVAEIARQEKELGSTYFHPRRPGKIWSIYDHILWAKRSTPNLTQLTMSEYFGNEEERFCAYAGLGVCE